MTSSQRNRVAVVTGGASGIGLASVAVLLKQGWSVVGFDSDAASITAAGESFAADAQRVAFVRVDVTDEAAVEREVRAAEARFGRLGGLVTCAGIARDLSFFETSAEIFRSIQEVNVVGTFIAARAAAAAMRDGGGGAIVTMSSVSGLVGNIGRSAYGASKGAVVNLTRTMAVELARYGIRVNGVAPGPVETPMVTAVHTDRIREQWHEQVLLERYGRPEEIAEAVAFLLDPDRSGYITGQTLAVDGGFVAAGLIGRDRPPAPAAPR